MRQTRENARVSVERASEALEVSATMVGHWETGRSFPSLEHLTAWLVMFEVSADWLLGTDLARIHEPVDEAAGRQRDEEELLLANYRRLDLRYRRAVREVARGLLDLDDD